MLNMFFFYFLDNIFPGSRPLYRKKIPKTYREGNILNKIKENLSSGALITTQNGAEWVKITNLPFTYLLILINIVTNY